MSRIAVLYESHHIHRCDEAEAGWVLARNRLQSVAEILAFLPNWDSNLRPTHQRNRCIYMFIFIYSHVYLSWPSGRASTFDQGGACSIPGKNIIFKLEYVLVRNVIHVIHYVPVLLPNNHLSVHNIFHYVPVKTPPPPPTALLQDI